MFKLYYELDSKIENLWLDYQDPNISTRKRKQLAKSMEELTIKQEQILTDILEDEAKQSQGNK